MKTGSNIAARYRESMGEVHEDAMIDDGCGRCDLWWLARELCGRVQQVRGESGGPVTLPSPYSVNLQVDPPHTRHPKYEP